MFHIQISRLIHKPIEDVFAILSDHANYQRFKGVDSSRLLEQGTAQPNGLGALREIVAGKSVLHERIVDFAAPHRIGYLIEYSHPLPYRHQLGIITLAEKDGGTEVSWESKGHIAIPLLGNWYFDKQIQKHGAQAFGSILKAIDMQ